MKNQNNYEEIKNIKINIEKEIQKYIDNIDELTWTITLNLIDRIDNFKEILLSEKKYSISDKIVSIRVHLMNLSNLSALPLSRKKENEIVELKVMKTKLSEIDL